MEKNKNSIKLFIGRRSIENYLSVSDSDLKEIDSNSIDHLRSEFTLNSYSKEKIADILTEYKRILKKGGTLIISVPDFFLVSDKYIKSKLKIEDVNRILTSKVFFDFMSIQKLLISCGFYAIKRLDVDKLDTDSKFYFNHENISLTIEAYG